VEGNVAACDRFTWITGRAGFPDGYLDGLRERAAAVPALSAQHLIEEVTYGQQYEFGADSWEPWPAPRLRSSRPRIALLDTGAKSNISRSLTVRGCRVSVLPYGVSGADVEALQPDGVVLANGPGDPETAVRAVETVSTLIQRYPLMGICLGHQVLGLAIGAKTSRLKFGHRGSNHPVKELASGRVCITAQNHGFQVEAESIPSDSGFAVSHVNLNDGSVEGMAHRDLPVFSVQYHPEAAPGPQDNQHLFDRFLDLVEQR
jgi:carbamoyl-phosphate synthase small subunit